MRRPLHLKYRLVCDRDRSRCGAAHEISQAGFQNQCIFSLRRDAPSRRRPLNVHVIASDAKAMRRTQLKGYRAFLVGLRLSPPRCMLLALVTFASSKASAQASQFVDPAGAIATTDSIGLLGIESPPREVSVTAAAPNVGSLRYPVQIT